MYSLSVQIRARYAERGHASFGTGAYMHVISLPNWHCNHLQNSSGAGNVYIPLNLGSAAHFATLSATQDTVPLFMWKDGRKWRRNSGQSAFRMRSEPGSPEYKTETISLKRTCSVPHLGRFPLPDLYTSPKGPYLDTSVVDCRWKNILQGKVPFRSEAIL